jgi:murein tripeptide amidase MpaA
MSSIEYTRYYRPHEIEAALQAWQQQYPQLCQLSSIGTSHEGRPIWLMTLTNRATGSDDQKPALLLDANIHASEVTGSMGALHLIETLLRGYGTDEALTELLDRRAIYVIPAVNPDGVEQALTSPIYVRSGTRPYPYQDERDGLYPADIDGDGLILQMRVPDPDGAWKISARDPRLMRKRAPDERGGTYYRLYGEGLIRNYNGHEVPVAPPAQGLDFNRNFPFSWQPEGIQRGAGPFPGSEVEIRALLQFVTAHPNISAAISYHTYSGAILRPYSDRPDEKLPVEDLWTFQELGARGTELTGYPHVSIYHNFRYHPRQIMSGSFTDWIYDQLGAYSFTVELWDIIKEAGISGRDFIGWFRDHPEEDDLKILQWNDTHLDGKGFVNWRPFDHPQLGPVEIGGWIERRTFGNPPEQFLLQTLEPNTRFVLAAAASGPCLELRHSAVSRLADDVWAIEAVVANSGYLPTYGSKRALETQAVEPISVTVALPDGAVMISGETRQTIGQLEGRSNKRAIFATNFPTDHLKRLTWTLRAPAGSRIVLQVRSSRAGSVSRELTLG